MAGGDARGGDARGAVARATVRTGIVLCLLLAAILLGADHQEYRLLTRAGVRALVRGALPLLALAWLHLLALDPPAWLAHPARRGVLVLALVADVALALAMLGPVRRGAPPAFPIALGVACLLAAGAIGLLLTVRATRRA